MKNVKTILVGVALCAAVFANNQRINALGNDSGFWPGDVDNVNHFPSTINDHAFVQVTGIGTDTDFDSNGDGVGDSDDAIAATILFGDNDTKWGFSYDKADTDSWFNIMWGSGDMGIKAGLVSSSTGASSGGDNTGFNFAYGQSFNWGELGVNLNQGMDNAGTWNDDYLSYGVKWRGDLGAWIFDGAKAGLTMTDDGSNNTSMVLDFDLFTHMDAGGADVLFGLGFGYASGDDGTNASSRVTLPSATVAIEADITDWATFRCFVNTDYTISNSNDDGTATGMDADGYTGSSTTYGVGLGFNWGAVTADMSISENLLQDPVSYMVGYNGQAITSGGVTLTYSF